MPRNALFSLLIACGSSNAVAISSSRLMSSMSNALRMCVQPALSSRATSCLIAGAVELRLHRVRRGGDLTEASAVQRF
jgi:hypothetical protein